MPMPQDARSTEAQHVLQTENEDKQVSINKAEAQIEN